MRAAACVRPIRFLANSIVVGTAERAGKDGTAGETLMVAVPAHISV